MPWHPLPINIGPICYFIRARHVLLASCGLAFFIFVFVLVLVLVYGWIGSIFGPPGFAARCGPLCREICSLVPRFPIGGPVAEHGCPRTESSREIVTLRKDWRISQKILPGKFGHANFVKWPGSPFWMHDAHRHAITVCTILPDFRLIPSLDCTARD